ncbi:hypothetical protein CO661_18205 [Sinorhizobium fredii]|uniref:Uncharacterized protein n=1 Tax=Rhizobium fredii TaxID=380 RepID=A0A2A6LVD9_RHIFR|nr:hypothetical protein CO661_18205 [Sinorhizobium fredii]
MMNLPLSPRLPPQLRAGAGSRNVEDKPAGRLQASASDHARWIRQPMRATDLVASEAAPPHRSPN